jgi:metal-dependent amidase/aminoacylase/carboxypeptidase family protein
MQRVIQCAQAGATATGATLKYVVKPGYAEMVPNMTMARTFANNWAQIGIQVTEPRFDERMGSTDMGNVSQAVPALHPYISIGKDLSGHTIEFRQAAVSPEGHAGLMNAAKGLAMTAIDLMSQPELLQQVKQEFVETNRK